MEKLSEWPYLIDARNGQSDNKVYNENPAVISDSSVNDTSKIAEKHYNFANRVSKNSPISLKPACDLQKKILGFINPPLQMSLSWKADTQTYFISYINEES